MGTGRYRWVVLAAGASGASVDAASGRAVLTWFPHRRRGLAMAVRQTSVPLGAAAGALALLPLAVTGSVPAVFAALAASTLVTAAVVAGTVREPPGAGPGRGSPGTRTTAPVREVLTDRALLRLSSAGMLLVVLAAVLVGAGALAVSWNGLVAAAAAAAAWATLRGLADPAGAPAA